MPRLKALAWPLACFAGYALLATLVFRSGLGPGRIIGDGGDDQQFVWFLAWTHFALAGGHNLLLTDWVVFPTGVNLAWNTSVTAVGLALAPVTWLAGPLASFQVAVVGSIALAALTAQLFAQRVLGSRPGAVVAGAVYGFSPYMMAHALGHLHALLWTAPLAALLVHSVLFGKAHPAALGAGIGLVEGVQAWIGEEFVLTTALAALLSVAILAGIGRRRDPLVMRRLAIAVAASLPVLLLLDGWLLGVQFLGPNRVLHRAPYDFFGNDLLGPLLPNHLQLVAFGSSLSDRLALPAAEQNDYLGLPLLALWAWIAIRRWSTPLVAWSTGLAVVLTLLSLGPRLYLAGVPLHVPFLWRPLVNLPLLDNVLPARLGVFVYLAAGLLCGWYLGQARLVGRLALAVALLPLVPTPSFPGVAVSTPAYFAPGRAPTGVVLVLPYSADGDATVLRWQAEAGMRFKLPEGYMRVPDAGGTAMMGPPASPLRDAMLELRSGRPTAAVDVSADAVRGDLRRLEVGEVVIGPCPEREAARAYFTELLGRPPAENGGVLLWRL